MSSAPKASVSSSAPAAAAAISGHYDTRTAALEIADRLHDELDGICDIALLFGSFHHAAAFPQAAETLRDTLSPSVLLGVTCESVLGEDRELEGLAGLSAMALRLPGVSLQPWSWSSSGMDLLKQPSAVAERIGHNDELRATLLLADPFTTPAPQLVEAIVNCGGGEKVPVLGGLASGASLPGHNVLVLNDQVLREGAIGVSISGKVFVDWMVSQGCRPIGRPLIVTKVKGNVILELGNQPALELLREIGGELDEHERSLLTKGLLVGVVIDEQKRHFGRGDFLIRNVFGFDQKSQGVAVAEIPRVGRTVQFHVRDADTAHEDLQLLLDAQALKGSPFAAVLFTCNGRGQRLFEEEHHDISVLRERLGDIPVAGCFAAGEIGPIGDRSFIHGHTASVALLRSSQP